MKKITLLIPCFNEESNLRTLHKALHDFSTRSFEIPTEEGGRTSLSMADYDWEFLFVNDGSSDDTLAVLREMRAGDPAVSLLSLSRNFGKENAMLAGMDYAKGDAVVIMDADLQHPLETIPEMIWWWEKGYDDVYGERLDRGKESRLRKSLSLSFYKLLDRVSNIETLPNVGDFRLLDRKAVNALTSMRESQRYTKGLYCWVGFNKHGVNYRQRDREAGSSSFNFIKLLNLAIDGITSYTTAPLRIATIAGLAVSLCAFCYLMFIFIKTLAWGEEVSGFPTLMCVILFLGGIQLVALGIIGEYIGRIFNEVKRRPPYIVESYNEITKEGDDRI